MSLSASSIFTFFLCCKCSRIYIFLDIDCLRSPLSKQNILCPAEHGTFSGPLKVKVCRKQSIQNRLATIELQLNPAGRIS